MRYEILGETERRIIIFGKNINALCDYISTYSLHLNTIVPIIKCDPDLLEVLKIPEYIG